MRIRINSNPNYYTNKTPILMDKLMYPLGIIFEFKNKKYYPTYQYIQGKLVKSSLQPLLELDYIPITEEILFEGNNNIKTIKVEGKENSFTELLEAPSDIYLKKNFFYEWFSLIYPLWMMQEISYCLFEDYICEITYHLLRDYEKLANKQAQSYDKNLVLQISQYFFNLLIMIQKLEYEEITKEPYSLIKLEQCFASKSFIEELKIRNSLLLDFIKK